MCFSPAASFTAAAVTGIVGGLTLCRCPSWRQAPLAAIPLLFAGQQASEGGIWLQLLHPSSPASLRLFTTIFTALALVVWPAWVPGAAAAVEPDGRRRRLQTLLLAVGLAAGAYSALDIVRHPYMPSIVGSSICYINNNAVPAPVAGAYFLAAALPFLLSSHGALRLFGLVIALGMAISLAAYFFTFVSVWCFFAALGSLLLYGHFRGRNASLSARAEG